MIRVVLAALSLAFSVSSVQAEVRVALLECRDQAGKLIQFEPGGRFCHSAIQVGGKWLQAYPGIGVSLVDRIEEYGHLAVILRSDSEQAPTPLQVQPLLGRPFDRSYDWSTDGEIYCAELLGKLLRIPTEPMDFSAPVWPAWFHNLNGKPGLSPDRIYRALLKRGYRVEWGH